VSRKSRKKKNSARATTPRRVKNPRAGGKRGLGGKKGDRQLRVRCWFKERSTILPIGQKQKGGKEGKKKKEEGTNKKPNPYREESRGKRVGTRKGGLRIGL